ncbi:hypothetical protein HUJ04_009966 [Dendroctonus ponderosae]|nr:hypothetical protein HUJ04_009966 [Dendroctonus ponderosae]
MQQKTAPLSSMVGLGNSIESWRSPTQIASCANPTHRRIVAALTKPSLKMQATRACETLSKNLSPRWKHENLTSFKQLPENPNYYF